MRTKCNCPDCTFPECSCWMASEDKLTSGQQEIIDTLVSDVKKANKTNCFTRDNLEEKKLRARLLAFRECIEIIDKVETNSIMQRLAIRHAINAIEARKEKLLACTNQLTDSEVR